MNKIFYRAVYRYYNGRITRTNTIFFPSPTDITHDAIKNYIKKKLNRPAGEITLHSVEKLDKKKFVELGGAPDLEIGV